MNGFFEIGTICGTHGVLGDIKIYPLTDDIRRFDLLTELTILNDGIVEKIPINGIRYHKNMVLAKLKGYDNIDDALKLKGLKVIIPREEAIKLSEDEYFISDLYDMQVITIDGDVLGVIADIIFTGANDVYVVRKNGKDVLIPAIKQCIKKVDINSRIMTVELLEGLL